MPQPQPQPQPPPPPQLNRNTHSRALTTPQLFNAAMFILCAVCCQRGLELGMIPLPLYTFMLTTDIMVSLVLLDSSLRDPFFW